MDTTITTGKLTTSIIISIICAEFKYYAPIFLLLSFCIFIDFMCGIMKSKVNGNYDSRVAVKGIYKKLGYVIAVVCAFAMDLLLQIAITNANVAIDVPTLFGMTICVLFTITELMSIIVNLQSLGVPIPKFFIKFLMLMRTKIEPDGEGAEELKK